MIGYILLRCDGVINSWANSLLMEVADCKRAPYIWEEFWDNMILGFESIKDTEEARNELRNLKQTRRVVGYTQKFEELQRRVLTMSEAEAYLAHLSSMHPHLCEHVGTHVHRNLEEASAMA